MEGTEDALSFSSNSSEGEKISDTVKVNKNIKLKQKKLK